MLGDTMIKYTNGWDIAKKIKPECFQENLPKSNYPMYGWLHETFNSSETKKKYNSRCDNWFAKTIIDLGTELKSEKSDVSYNESR